MTALAAALSLQDKVEQYGAYAGVAAVFGLGVLSLLYFAQAREVKRLREWAGRAPERAAELEARAVAVAEEKLASDDGGPAVPVPAAATAAAVAAGNGAGAVVPAAVPPEVAPVPGVPASRPTEPQRAPGPPASLPAAATAAATAAGARAAAAVGGAGGPGAPGGGVPASAGGVATLPATAAATAPPVTGGGPPAAGPTARGAAPAAGVPASAPNQVNGGGAKTVAGATGRGQAPPRPQAAPLRASGAAASVPPRTAAGASRRGRPGAPPSTGGRSRATIVGIVAGAAVLVALAAVIGFVVIGGGDDNRPASAPNTLAPAASAPAPAKNNSNAAGPGSAKVDRGKVTVAVLNGTTFTGLARSASDKLTKAGFKQGVVTNDTTNQTRSATAVFYGNGQRNAALVVARIIGIGRDAVQKLDANTRGVAGPDANVVVSVGADQAR